MGGLVSLINRWRANLRFSVSGEVSIWRWVGATVDRHRGLASSIHLLRTEYIHEPRCQGMTQAGGCPSGGVLWSRVARAKACRSRNFRILMLDGQ